MSEFPGSIRIVGAGPGDPGLVTVKGREVIRQADILFHSSDIPYAILSLAPEGTKRKVLKAPCEKDLNLLLEALKRGKKVVLLFKEDPYFSVDGMRIIKELAKTGVTPEVIPGLPALTAAPSYAGMLWRGSGSLAHLQFPKEPFPDPIQAEGIWEGKWEDLVTLIRHWLQRGMDGDTSATWIDHGTRAEQQVWTGSLRSLVDSVHSSSTSGVLVIGGMALRQKALAWYESKPLFGRRILVTRSRTQSGDMARKIYELGGEAVEFPVIRTVPPRNQEAFDQAMRQLSDFDWVVFTSVNGVDFFFQRINQLKLDIRRMVGAKIAAIGPKTAEALERKGIRVDLQPPEYRAESLVKVLKPLVRPGEHILLPRANIARKLLATELEDCGCYVTDVDAYDTLPALEGVEEVIQMLERGYLHILTFTSSSTVRYFMEVLLKAQPNWKPLLQNVQVACIGPITADTATNWGLHVDVIAKSYTIDGLLEALLQLPPMDRE